MWFGLLIKTDAAGMPFDFSGGTKGRIIGGRVLWAGVPGFKSGSVIDLCVFW